MSLTTNQRVYRPGDSVVLSATITPSSVEQGTPADLYVIATLGNGETFSLGSSLSWAAGRIPMFAGFPLGAVNAPRFHSVPVAGLPNGIYTLYLLAVRPRTDPTVRGNWLGSSVSTFSVQGGGAAGIIGLQAPARLQASVFDTKVHTFTTGQGLYDNRSHLLADLDGDGYPELVIGVSTYPDQTTEPIIVVGAKGGITLPAATMFGGSIPVSQHPPVIVARDINGDGLPDLIVSNAGLDHPPFTGGLIAVALNQGGGRFRNVSSSIPAWTAEGRSYSLAVGDLNGNGTTQIVLPAQGGQSGRALLTWNGTGFDADPNWISDSLWLAPVGLNSNSWLGIYDLDGDGRQDLIVSGNQTRPALRVIYGTRTAPFGTELGVLPEGPFSHTLYEDWFLPGNPASMGADANVQIVADFSNSGRLDIFSLQEQVIYYQAGVFTDTADPAYDSLRGGGSYYGGGIALQVVTNQGNRKFADRSQLSSVQDLGTRYYVGASPVDLNNDGFVDVVGVYYTKPSSTDKRGNVYGTTFFLNDGTGAFNVVDAAGIFPGLLYTDSSGRSQLGHFFPTKVTSTGMEAIVLENRAGWWDGTKTYRFKKVIVQGSIGTGPGLHDPAERGAAGFNEFFYLNTYPDAVQSVLAGRDATGLDHYIRVGQSMGYARSAVVATQ